jgi:hypothetical protein
MAMPEIPAPVFLSAAGGGEFIARVVISMTDVQPSALTPEKMVYMICPTAKTQ